MAELRTEEEQIDAIKRWWRANGRATVLGVVAAIAIVLGWRSWQDYQQNAAEAASALYQNMLASAVKNGQSMTDEDRASAIHLAQQLKDEFASTTYAVLAASWLAKSAAEQGNLEEAQQQLQWILEQEPEAPMAMTTRLRLARILLAQGDTGAALNRLGDKPAPGFAASYYEIKGDALLAEGDRQGARSAYQQAMAAPNADQRPLLAMKYDDLATAEDL